MPIEPILAETIAGTQRTMGAEGDFGYQFFGRSAEKVVFVRKSGMIASCAA